MRAYLASPATDVPVLTDQPVPTLDPEMVLVKVAAVALNNADLSPVKEAAIPGYEFAGTVVSVADGVSSPPVGATVMGIAAHAFAEYVAVDHRHVLPVPQGVSLDVAATLPTALMTEYGALGRAEIAQGDTVLVTAATSAIAMMGVQVARLLGASSVIGTTRSAQHRDVVKASGADHVVVTSEQDLAEAVHEITEGRGADVVLDHVGGEALADAVQAARIEGMVVSVGRLGGAVAPVDLFALARRRVTLRSVSYGTTPVSTIGDLFEGVTSDVLPAVEDGRIVPVHDATFPFDDMSAAFARLAGDEGHGKVALRLS